MMNAISLYITTCRYIVESNTHEAETWADLYKYLPILRQALSCCVCTKILHHPMGPTESACQHHVCSSCLGGKMRLRPSCSWCKDFNCFVDNAQLRIVVQCFRKLCEYLASSAIAVNLAATNNGGTTSNALMAIIQEGLSIRDDFSASPGCRTANPAPPTLQKVNGPTPISPRRGYNKASFQKKEVNHSKNDNKISNGVSTLQSEISSSVTPSTILTMPVPTTSCKHDRRPSALRSDRTCIKRRRRRSAQSVNMSCRVGTSKGESPTIEKVEKSPTRSNNTKDIPKVSNLQCVDVVTVRDELCNDKLITKNGNIPMFKLSETVAIEHDYNKGMDSNSEQTRITPELLPTVKMEAAVVLKKSRVELCRAPIHGRCSQTESKKSSKKSSSRNNKVKTGCRCGLATAKPGNLTCCGQRCPCYSSFKGCVDCRCRGCRNPRGDPAKNPLALQLQQMQQQHLELQMPLLQTTVTNEDSDIEVDV